VGDHEAGVSGHKLVICLDSFYLIVVRANRHAVVTGKANNLVPRTLTSGAPAQVGGIPQRAEWDASEAQEQQLLGGGDG